jgi:REP element-mobilizing transposase RayT
MSELSDQHRRSIRLKGFDYTKPGAYFVTICTHRRDLLFGDVASGQMKLSAFGQIAHDEWWLGEKKRPDIQLDVWTVMPNHVHGIVSIVPGPKGTARRAPTELPRRFGRAISGALATLVGAYKSAVARRINQARQTPAQPVWQKGFYEHVVRNETELNRIREYISCNPERWPFDPDNPAAVASVDEPEPWDL